MREIGDFSRLVLAYGPEYREAFAFAAGNKYKVTPYVVAFGVAASLVNLTGGGRRGRWLAFLVLACGVGLLSNMRSALLGVAIGVAFAVGATAVRHARLILDVRIAMWSGVLLIVALASTVWLTGKYRSFESQVVDKGLSEEFGRTDALIEALTLQSTVEVGFIGRGLGAALQPSQWRSRVNPKDSAAEHAVLAGGLPLLVVWLAGWLMLALAAASLLLGAWNATESPSRALNVGLAAAATALLINHYNDSHLLYVPNAAVAGLIAGMTMCSAIRSRRWISARPIVQ